MRKFLSDLWFTTIHRPVCWVKKHDWFEYDVIHSSFTMGSRSHKERTCCRCTKQQTYLEGRNKYA